MAKFIMTEPRYIRQKGQSEPSYVNADPLHPVVIELDDDVKVDVRLKPHVEQSPPAPPDLVPPHAVIPKEGVPKASEVHGPGAKKGRLSDA